MNELNSYEFNRLVTRVEALENKQIAISDKIDLAKNGVYFDQPKNIAREIFGRNVNQAIWLEYEGYRSTAWTLNELVAEATKSGIPVSSEAATQTVAGEHRLIAAEPFIIFLDRLKLALKTEAFEAYQKDQLKLLDKKETSIPSVLKMIIAAIKNKDKK